MRGTILLEHTLLRFEADVRANKGIDATRWADCVRRLALILNGDWRRQCVHVYVDAPDFIGRHLIGDRALLVALVVNGIIETGMFGGVITNIPAKSRWGTCASANGVNASGRYCHGLGRRRIQKKRLRLNVV